MFPMTAKTTMTEEAYRRFAWANFWYRKTGLFPLIIGEVALLAVGLVCLFFRSLCQLLVYLFSCRSCLFYFIVLLTNNSSSSIRIILSGMIWSRSLASMRQTFKSLIAIIPPDITIRILWRFWISRRVFTSWLVGQWD
ncbi:hypothetical protein TZ88_01090 [Streptococcus gordonii]|uniref:Uncharacterized protein n=1 Tax=Streptococcus gordonii TaxID=1302 RepID=A0AB34SA61_STRGN|nr:hypothetical protein TZ88_01090 [Streptococcus gordonii]